MTEQDEIWFNDHPWRYHRVRPVCAEDGVPPNAPPGCTRVAVIRRLRSCRLITAFAVERSPRKFWKLNEAAAAAIFDRAAASEPTIRALLARAERDETWP